ncbi:MAG: lipopolysaccharide heptosyltransferase II [Anaerolineae bacterium]|nr:MAG: lipopolysaccharide heptosyltransferase II [Anaerolineae bacterium]
MQGENFVTVAAANLARIPFWLKGSQRFTEPSKVLILKPCCISQVMMATPLLTALSETYPEARFDWAVDQWSRAAVSGNPRITRLVDTGSVFRRERTIRAVSQLIAELKDRDYDTCFVPSRSSLACYIVWRAGIRQRIGLSDRGRGFAYTMPVSVPNEVTNQAVINLQLAKAVEIEIDAGQEFYPSDQARSAITELMVDEVGWHGEQPLVIIHPGGGENPLIADSDKRWPLERFALFANRLSYEGGAKIVLISSEREKKLVSDIIGLMSARVVNLAGRLDIDQIGALAEVADLYVGNDAGPTHVAAAVGCKTLVIFGPTDPLLTAPYATKGKVTVVAPKEGLEPFDWEGGPTVEGAVAAAEKMLSNQRSTH